MLALKTGEDIRNVIMRVFNPKVNDNTWININAIPNFKQGESKPYQVYTTFDDITHLKNAEEALRENEELLNNIIESMSDGILVMNPDFQYTYWNRAMEKISKTPREELVGTDKIAWEVFPHLAEQGIDRMMREAMQGNVVTRESIPYSLKDGTEGFTSEIFLPLRNETGEIRGIVGVVREVTERKQNEERLIEERNFAELYLDILGHDINNINQAIMTSTELLLMDRNMTEKTRNYIKNLYQQSQRITDLVRNVRRLSQLKKSEFEEKNIDVSQIIDNSKVHIQKVHSGRRIEINHSISDSEVLIKSSELLQDLFDNIINNAVKYDQNEDVVVDIVHTLDENGNFWRLEIKDKGPGVPDKLKHSIFKRLEQDLENLHGFGVGLTVAHEIVNRSGGRVWVEDRVKGEPEKGSNFVVLLPKAN
jgi:PAS domain S-box-containing protein